MSYPLPVRAAPIEQPPARPAEVRGHLGMTVQKSGSYGSGSADGQLLFYDDLAGYVWFSSAAGFPTMNRGQRGLRGVLHSGAARG